MALTRRVARTHQAAGEAARAGLHYVRPGVDPGYTRRRRGKAFVYHTPRGARLTHAPTLERIRKLVIPPAWEEVWISVDARGHVQATGRDARRRLQYRYHPLWSEHRHTDKFSQLGELCRALPRVRRVVRKDLTCPCPCRRMAAAAVVALMEQGQLRVGNAEYTRQNGTYGGTTLEKRHVRLQGSRIDLTYRGKSGIVRHVVLEDALLVAALRRCMKMGGRRIFHYVEGGRIRHLEAADVNDYLRERCGVTVTAKFFRTWAASLCCLARLAAKPPPDSKTSGKRQVTEVIKEVAARLGHTPTVCRKSYVHPRVIERFMDGTLAKNPRAAARDVDWQLRGRWVGHAEKALLDLVTG